MHLWKSVQKYSFHFSKSNFQKTRSVSSGVYLNPWRSQRSTGDEIAFV